MSDCNICKSKIETGNVSVTCGTCREPRHAACIEPWKGKISPHGYDLAGLCYYCPPCLKKLDRYVFAPHITGELSALNARVETLTKMATESLKINRLSSSLPTTIERTHAEVRSLLSTLDTSVKNTSTPNTEITEIKDAVNNIKRVQSTTNTDQIQPEIQEIKKLINTIKEKPPQPKEVSGREDLRQNVIINGVPEGMKQDLQSRVLTILGGYNIHYTTVSNIYRVGRYKDTQTRPRPIKLTFISQVVKREFMRNFHQDPTNEVYVTNDLTKEEQQKEYDLRVKKRTLVTENPSNKYRIRSGKVESQETSSSPWVALN